MKIKSLRSSLLTREHGAATGPGCLLEIVTHDGLSGWAAGSADAGARAVEMGGQLLAGEDPRGVTGLWERLNRARPAGADPEVEARAAALLDVALWDLKARINGEALWKTLGGAPPRAPAYAAFAGVPGDDRELKERFSNMARQWGIRGGALPCSDDADRDLERLALMRETLAAADPEPVLLVSAGGRWPVKEAVRRVREMEKRFDLTWVEAPVASRDHRGLGVVSRAVSAAVCAGRDLPRLEDFQPHFRHHALDVVQLDIGLHGITAALQIADAAYGYELPVSLCAVPGNIHAHLAGVLPYIMNVEILDPLPAGALTTDVRVDDGWVMAGNAAGNGLQQRSAAA